MVNRSIKVRVLAVVLVLVFSVLFPLNVLAESITVIRPVDIINIYRTEEDTEYEIAGQKRLLSISGGSDYTLYELSPYGYAILFNETNGLMEACYAEGASSPISMTDGLQYYYGGPGVYCIKDNNGYYNLFDGDYLDDECLADTILVEAETQETEMEKASSIIMNAGSNVIARGGSSAYAYQHHTVAFDYFYNLVDFGVNNLGTCTVIAITMLLGYYDNFEDNSIVPGMYENGVGTNDAFHQLLISYIYDGTPQGGILIRNTLAGMSEYFDDRSLPYALESQYSSLLNARSFMLTKLQSGEPVIASMGKENGASMDHTVLVYRVTYNPTNPINTAVFTMNLGWPGDISNGYTAFTAAASWFYECGYLVSTD